MCLCSVGWVGGAVLNYIEVFITLCYVCVCVCVCVMCLYMCLICMRYVCVGA